MAEPNTPQPYVAPDDFHELLAYSGLSPEVFRSLTGERVDEYRRALQARRDRAAEQGVADNA